MMEDLTYSLQVLGQIGLAALLGGCIGLEREMHGQAAGLRTHMVVAAASCLIMLVSLEVTKFGSRVQPPDPGRIAAQVVTGIGFLGAGAILRFGLTVRGLTTAACIWAAAAIGLAVGIQFYPGALACTLVVLVAIYVFDRIEKRLLIGRQYKKIVIVAQDVPDLSGEVETRLHRFDLQVKSMGVHRDLVEKKIRLEITVSAGEGTNFESVIREITSMAGVERLDIE